MTEHLNDVIAKLRAHDVADLAWLKGEHRRFEGRGHATAREEAKIAAVLL